MQQAKLRLGELLVDAEVLTEARLIEALDMQKESGSRLGTVLIQKGFVTEPQLVQALSRQMSIPWVSLWHLDISEQLLDMIPEELVLKNGVLPIYIRTLKGGEKALYVAMDNPADVDLLEEIGAACGMKVKPMIAGPSEIASAILSYYGAPWEGAPVQPPAAQRISSVPPPPRPRQEAEEDHILLEEVVEEPEEEPVEPDAGTVEEPVELTEPLDEHEQAAQEKPEDLFAPREREAPRRARKFRPASVNLTFLDGTSISFKSKQEREEQAREARGAMESRIDGLGLEGEAGAHIARVVKGILLTLMKRGLLTESELEELLEQE
jgi:type IV pilus assembly protein PilB